MALERELAHAQHQHAGATERVGVLERELDEVRRQQDVLTQENSSLSQRCAQVLIFAVSVTYAAASICYQIET